MAAASLRNTVVRDQKSRVIVTRMGDDEEVTTSAPITFDPLHLLERAHEFDLSVYRAVAQHHAPWLDMTLPRLSHAADNSKLWVGISLALVLIDGKRGRRAALQGLTAVAFTSALTNGPLKWLLKRNRPDAEIVPQGRRRPMPYTSSFPSGHSASALAFATGASMAMPAAAP
ncbi:MAG: phosphatase PAP2 family protein, partial [Thermoleophilia bacterium]|nr:phosphatase PAP2 family protein [Thermoleophilia bacterium]